ncbi:MAG: carboxypeptidase-like regulatory domain-containing protein [Bacteroidetes bacterium]|nr:carboxypeptidase-like regulatory domain-containing protein [Bacteroidota bacterium]
MNFLKVIFFLLLPANFLAQQLIKGVIVERDSATLMPFVYIINKSNGNGTMSDNDGRFTLLSKSDDTLICSYVGYAKLYVPVKSLKSNEKGLVKLIMGQQMVNLNTVTVTTFKIKPYERDYMQKIIDESKIRKLDYLGSPITALYMQYSKEGRQIRKLAKIFEDLFDQEQVAKKLTPEILARLTGDENIDFEAFRRYCYYISNYFIINHEGAELYSKVMDCYKTFKAERRTR